MKNYRSVSLNRIKDFETYAEKKLKAGHIIIEIRLNEERNEIRKIVSYAQDKNEQTWIWQKTDSEELKRSGDPCFCLENPDNEKIHCQYYVSVKQGDFKNWGGPSESVFIREWMSAYGSEKSISWNRDFVQEAHLKAGETFSGEDITSVETSLLHNDSDAKVLEQETFLLKNKMFRVHNFYNYESLVWAQDASLIYRKMLYKGKYYLIGQYRLMGACMDECLEKDYWRPCTNLGSRILKMEQPSEADDKTRSKKCSREAFAGDTVETCSWIALRVSDEEAEIPFDMEYLLSDPVCDKLLHDIVGEVG